MPFFRGLSFEYPKQSYVLALSLSAYDITFANGRGTFRNKVSSHFVWGFACVGLFMQINTMQFTF